MICIKEIDKMIYDNLNQNYSMVDPISKVKKAKKQLEFYRKAKTLLSIKEFTEDYFKQELKKIEQRLNLLDNQFVLLKNNNHHLTHKQAKDLFNETYCISELKHQADILTFILKGSKK